VKLFIEPVTLYYLTFLGIPAFCFWGDEGYCRFGISQYCSNEERPSGMPTARVGTTIDEEFYRGKEV
jgi:hypothetical protein